MKTVICSLQDLIKYFQTPCGEQSHEEKQKKIAALKKRQNMFKEEVGMVEIKLRLLFCLSEEPKNALFVLLRV